MITIQSNRLIIDLEHPEPKEYLKDLQDALFVALRLISADAANDSPLYVGREFCDASFAMLDLLQSIIVDTRIVRE
ncbi:MAG TPA: hypothetical protein VFJ43_07065 [Bacteroidia bacterium]|nr:hypothetical protein [Bacteroidia bacterium]